MSPCLRRLDAVGTVSVGRGSGRSSRPFDDDEKKPMNDTKEPREFLPRSVRPPGGRQPAAGTAEA